MKRWRVRFEFVDTFQLHEHLRLLSMREHHALTWQVYDERTYRWHWHARLAAFMWETQFPPIAVLMLRRAILRPNLVLVREAA